MTHTTEQMLPFIAADLISWPTTDRGPIWSFDGAEISLKGTGWFWKGGAATNAVLSDGNKIITKDMWLIERVRANPSLVEKSSDDTEGSVMKEITTSKYTKQIRGVSIDVYDVLKAWGVTNPALQHLIKKALQCGERGHKDAQQDLQDIIDSAVRAKELEQ
ncbi:MAG: hypothetical protein ACRDC6_06225 [Shewanella sp.]